MKLTDTGRIAFFSFCLLASSCTTRQDVHIYSKGVSKEEVIRLSELIENAGFNAHPNSLEVPPIIGSTSIMYPPIVEDFSNIEMLEDLLKKNGYIDITLITDSQEGHSYTTENMGLYLVDPNYIEEKPESRSEDTSTSINLSRVYFSNCIEYEADISLYAQGVAILNIYDWVDEGNDISEGVLDGEWTTTDQRLLINLYSLGELEYEISEFMGRDDYGRYYGIELHNSLNTTELPLCDYRYIEY